MRTLASALLAALVAAVLVPSAARAGSNSGYKIFRVGDSKVPVHFAVTADNVVTTEPDFWNQCTVTLLGLDVNQYGFLRSAPAWRLLDGECELVRDELLAASHGQGLDAQLVVELDEVIEWGAHEHGDLYCRRTLQQIAYLVGDPLFPAYEYQASSTVTLSEMSHADCVRLYASP